MTLNLRDVMQTEDMKIIFLRPSKMKSEVKVMTSIG